jgi:ribosomal protein L18
MGRLVERLSVETTARDVICQILLYDLQQVFH